MPLLPEELTSHSLRRRWRGYDRTQIDQLLTRAQGSYVGALERLADTADDLARARADRAQLRRQLDALAAPAHPDRQPMHNPPDDVADTTPTEALPVVRPALAHAATSPADSTHTAGAHRDPGADLHASPAEHGGNHSNGTHADTKAEPRFGLNRDDERRVADQLQRLETELGELRSQVTLLDQIHHMEQALAALRDGVVASGSSQPRRPPSDSEPR